MAFDVGSSTDSDPPCMNISPFPSIAVNCYSPVPGDETAHPEVDNLLAEEYYSDSVLPVGGGVYVRDKFGGRRVHREASC